jgi:hypothetical protein
MRLDVIRARCHEEKVEKWTDGGTITKTAI